MKDVRRLAEIRWRHANVTDDADDLEPGSWSAIATDVTHAMTDGVLAGHEPPTGEGFVDEYGARSLNPVARVEVAAGDDRPVEGLEVAVTCLRRPHFVEAHGDFACLDVDFGPANRHIHARE